MKQQERPPAEDAVLRSLSDSCRRNTLRLVQERASPLKERELATNLVAEERDKPVADVGRAEAKSIYIDLIYIHLPQLQEEGLIRWNREEETVTTSDHPALSDPNLQQMIAVNAAGWDAVLANLAHERRRIILSILKNREDGMTREELTDEIVARERDTVTDEHLSDATDDLLAELHHVHLPKLQQADLIAYDTEIDTVSYRGHPALVEEWLHFHLAEASQAIVPTAQDSNDIWTIKD